MHQVPGCDGRRLADASVSNDIAIAIGKLENVWVITRRLVSCILLACAACFGVAACSSSSSTPPAASSPSATPSATPSPTSTGSASSGTTADEKAITTNWTAFFNPKTPVAQRVKLLQDGSAFASVIQSQAGSALAGSASAQVTKVTVITTSEAAVTYNVLLAGTPALKNQAGTAVYQDGTWKVGVASFCGLLSLENGGKSSGLPSVCKSAT
jgi:hypothetical protein